MMISMLMWNLKNRPVGTCSRIRFDVNPFETTNINHIGHDSGANVWGQMQTTAERNELILNHRKAGSKSVR